MRFILHIFLAFLVCAANCDTLYDKGYRAEYKNKIWEVSRGGSLLNRFWMNPASGRIRIYKAWNKFDSEPRLPLRDIMVYVWIRAGGSLDKLNSVQVVDVNNQKTNDAIAAAREVIGKPHPEDFEVDKGYQGWNALSNSPFFWSVQKMCDEWKSLDGKSVTSMRVMSAEGSLDDLIMYIS
ncbi:hypothetical protein C8035_v003174 [Colletotrichum spinosum]|uniref:Uncharacterized protein n=1 Tax=Colletotrichum spinosum TaxID=1347390 RepID=A0A4R8Q3V1_9PEZI|nr:hypothetical protein C8035_v003174 [Colletotrichum spinosum]